MKWYNRKRKSSPEVTQQENLKNGSTKVEDGFSNSKSATSFIGLYKYSSAQEKLLMTLGTLCAILTGLTVPMNSFIFGDLTDAMIRYSMFGGTEDLWEGVNRFAIYNSVLGGVMLICSYISVVTFNVAAQNQTYRIRGLFFKAVLHQDISWYDVHQTGEVASRMNEDLQKLEDGLGEKVPMFMHFIVAFFGSLILGITKGWELALVCLSSMPVTFISIGAVGMITSKLAAKEAEAYAKAGSIAEEVLSAIRTVVAFGGEKIEVDRYKTNLKSAKEINIKKGYFAGIGFGLLWFFIYASYALAFWYGVGLVLEEFKNPIDEIHYTPGVMLTVFFSIMMGTMNLGLASPYIETFSVSKGAATNVFSLIEQTPSKDSMNKDAVRPEGPIECISFQNVHFEYPTRPDIKVLKGINIDIHKGQTVALVGTSGCGKSTCIQLLQRFYDPSSGSILLNGRDVRDIDVQWIRARIGIVWQEPVLFGTTVYENILFGNSSAQVEDIEKAAKAANAHEFIKNLPSGYETLIGERGAQLSGGQKQRIAIARALVRDPEILLLDEATSALDLASEAKVQHALEVASKGRTTIVVAHRLSTVINADKIIVLNDGKIMEAGTHTELIKLKGYYSNLVTSQLAKSFEKKGSESINEKKSMETGLSEDAEESIPIQKDNEFADVEKSSQPTSFMEIVRLNWPEWRFILFGGVCSTLMGFSMPLFAVLFGDIIGILSNPDVEYVKSETNLYCIYFVLTGIAIGIATFLQISTLTTAGEKMTERLRALCFQAMIKQEIGWFDDNSNGTGTLCARLSTDTAAVQGATGQRIGSIVQSLATLFLSVGLSMYYQWKLGLVTLAFTPFILIATYSQRQIMQGEDISKTSAMEKSTKLAIEVISSIRTVISLGCEDTFYHQYMNLLAPSVKKAKIGTHFRGFVYGLARSLMFFAYAACMSYGGYLIVEEDLFYGDVFKVSQALIMGTVSIANALAFAPNFERGLNAASKILTLLNRVPLVRDSVQQIDMWKNEGDLRFNNVEFTYPSRVDTKVLRNFCMEVAKGKNIGLVGSSGCGKSTCMQLIPRFYDVTGGQISVDLRDIRDVPCQNLRQRVGIVFQEPTLFDRTIFDNIAYGKIFEDVQLEEVIDVAKKSNIHDFIMSLPQGYDTRIGEKGTQLSGGQKQRIAIARALVRNPVILLLDESTAALDAESEKIVQAALDVVKEGRTCITIAHRLSTVINCDIIFVMEAGQVVEQGTHNELMNMNGYYYNLYKLQST